MKTKITGMMLFAAGLLLNTPNTQACSCYHSEARVINSLARMQNIDQSAIKIIDFKEKFNPVFAIPNIIKAKIYPEHECSLGCSLEGVRIIAQVEYSKLGKVCTAKLIKPARREDSIKLKEIVCL
jgi:hypothetical protein